MGDRAKKEIIHTYNAWRGIAALMILFSHMSYLEDGRNPFWRWVWTHFMKNGAQCSTLFFLLSGYLLAYTWKNQQFGDYMKSKLKRIYPLTLTVFVLAMLVDIVLQGSEVVSEGVALFSGRWFFNVAANILLFKAFIPQRGTFYSFHGPSWYISVLFFLYIVAYPFIKREKNGSDRKKWLKMIGGGCCAAYALQLLLCAVVHVNRWDALYLCYINPYFRIFGEGFAGILLCEYEETIQNKLAGFLQKSKISYTVAELFVSLFFITCFFAKDFIKLNIWSAWLQIIPMGMILIVFRQGKGKVANLLTRRPGLFLGTISFELYMTHAFVYEGIPIVAGIISEKIHAWLIYHAGIRFGITLITCIVFAWIVKELFAKSRSLKQKPKFAIM